MSIIYLIPLSIALYIVYQYITVRYIIVSEKPPKPVRIAGMLEGAFAMLVSAPICFIHDNNFLKVFFMLLCLFWICVAVSLYRASKVGRTICLVLSILRIPTVIGAVFSALSLYMLYVRQESKDFFNKAKKQKQ